MSTIITRDKKICFIHIPKTAGTSMEAWLGQVCGGPHTRMNTKFECDDLPEDEADKLANFEHARARDVKKNNPDIWEKCWSFSIVRNPWDRMVSTFHWIQRQGFAVWAHIDDMFREAEAGGRAVHGLKHKLLFYQQVDWVTDESGEQIVDWVGQFEALGMCMQTVYSFAHCKHGHPAASCPYGHQRPELPERRKSNRVGNYRDYFTTWSRNLVADWFKDDILYFHYTY